MACRESRAAGGGGAMTAIPAEAATERGMWDVGMEAAGRLAGLPARLLRGMVARGALAAGSAPDSVRVDSLIDFLNSRPESLRYPPTVRDQRETRMEV